MDVTVVVRDVDLGVMDAVLEGSDGLAEGLSTDEHVAGLGDLELVAVLSEEGAVGVEVVDGLLEVGNRGVSRGGGLGATVVVMLGVVVVVVAVELVVWVDVVVITLHLGGSGSSDEKRSSESFHF